RNLPSHANKARASSLAEWALLADARAAANPAPGVLARSGRKALPWRFRRAIHVVDATTIQLGACCIDGTRRRRKAAFKRHRRLDLRSSLPSCAVVEIAGEHDDVRAQALCAGLREREIVLFGTAHLFLRTSGISLAASYHESRGPEKISC
ncbi:MAG: hypothetical protein RLZZ15_3216, partial [Verrucomicrobiota bacterium]